MKSFFPDVNVWIALAYAGHQHHADAVDWFESLDSETVCFCRFTQLGFLRLLTQPTVMHEDVRTQKEAWQAYDLIAQDPRVNFQAEADGDQVDFFIRKLTSRSRPSAKPWPDAYLAAFAHAAGHTLVTFDRGLHAMAAEGILLAL